MASAPGASSQRVASLRVAQLDGRGCGDGRSGGRGGDLVSNVDKGARHEQQMQQQQMQQMQQMHYHNQNREHHVQTQAQHQQMLAMAGANLLPQHQLLAAHQQAAATC